jgi:hypothetical protein
MGHVIVEARAAAARKPATAAVRSADQALGVHRELVGFRGILAGMVLGSLIWILALSLLLGLY